MPNTRIFTFSDVEDRLYGLDVVRRRKIFDDAYVAFNEGRSLFLAFKEALNNSSGGRETVAVLSSSNVKLLEYSPSTQDLYVVFSNDARYVYHDVPQDVWNSREDWTSVGQWINVY